MGISIGRTAFIAGLAAALFGVFLLVAPRLTASDEATPATSIASTTVVTAPITASTATTTTATTTPTTVTTTTIPVVTTTAPIGWDPAEMTPANGYDGTITMSAAFTGPLGDKEWAIIADQDTVSWQVHVVNTTDGPLWGVFAWVEGFGRAYCDSTRLAPFGETDCWASGTAYAGETEVVAWVNAWTETTQVKAKVRATLAVAP